MISLINLLDEEMLHITLRQIEVFVATAKRGSVTQAAADIGLTQSAASMALAECESQLGTRLFDRLGKRLLLNDHGRALVPRAVELLDRAEALAHFFKGEGRATALRLGASSTVGNYLLPQVIGSYRRARPDSQFQLMVSNSHAVIDAVRHFEVDMGFIEGPCLDAEIESIPWQTDELAVCAAPGHPLARRRTPSPEALREADWILRERGSGTREVVEEMLRTQLGTIRLAMELGGTEAIRRAVESGMGIACLPRVVIDDAVRSGRLVRLRTPFLQLTRPLTILLHRQKFRTEGIASLLAFCTRKGKGSGVAAREVIRNTQRATDTATRATRPTVKAVKVAHGTKDAEAVTESAAMRRTRDTKRSSTQRIQNAKTTKRAKG